QNERAPQQCAPRRHFTEEQYREKNAINRLQSATDDTGKLRLDVGQALDEQRVRQRRAEDAENSQEQDLTRRQALGVHRQKQEQDDRGDQVLGQGENERGL